MSDVSIAESKELPLDTSHPRSLLSDRNFKFEELDRQSYDNFVLAESLLSQISRALTDPNIPRTTPIYQKEFEDKRIGNNGCLYFKVNLDDPQERKGLENIANKVKDLTIDRQTLSQVGKYLDTLVLCQTVPVFIAYCQGTEMFEKIREILGKLNKGEQAHGEQILLERKFKDPNTGNELPTKKLTVNLDEQPGHEDLLRNLFRIMFDALDKGNESSSYKGADIINYRISKLQRLPGVLDRLAELGN
jgi:hypothetical protein